jgi:hypothetical protein
MENIRSIYFFKKQEEEKPVEERNENLIRLLEADLNYKLRDSNKTHNKGLVMNEIKIFIASQRILTKERDFVETLIRQKNDDFFRKNIYLKPIRWELADKGNSIERKQDEFNRLLLNSEFVIYLTWDSIGHYTKEEFKIGYDSMKTGAKPFRLYVFNKAVAQRVADVSTQGVQDFLELKEQLWKDEKIIVDYADNLQLQNEIGYLFSYIENNYPSVF